MKAIGVVLLLIGIVIIGYLVFVKKSVATVVNDIVSIGAAKTSASTTKSLTELLKGSGGTVPIATNKLSSKVGGVLLGKIVVDGTYVNIWSEREGYLLYNYPNSAGFMEDGTIVYAHLFNEGTPEEYTSYSTNP